MAGGVLVEQRVEEQDAALRDRRGMRHQRHLAEPARALVGVEHLVQHVLAARRLGLDDPARLEAHRDIRRSACPDSESGLVLSDMAVDAPCMRRGEDLLGRDVRIAGDAVLGRRGAALPFVAVGKPDRQVGARPGIVQRRESRWPFSQLRAAACSARIVRRPGRDRIVADRPARRRRSPRRSLATATSSASPGKTCFAQDAVG